MAASTGWVGSKFNRKEDRRLLVGKGKYLADLAEPGMLHLVFARSQRAHARIKRIDTSAAAAMPGVVKVVTGADIKDKIPSLPQPVVVPALPANYPKFWPLAVDKVKFHGEPVAAVVARDKYTAEDAAEAIVVEYDPLPYVGDPESALKPGAPKVHEDWKDNLIFAMTFTGGPDEESQRKNDAEVEKQIKEADIVIKQRFKTHRCGVTPMETRGALCI
jgi:carbon-monoxide dehydrogenase large subunit